MSHCCCFITLILSLLLIIWGSVASFHVFSASNEQFMASYAFAVFTLLAAAIVIIIGLAILSFQLFDISKDIFSNINQVSHGICCSLFLVLLLEVLCITSAIVFFKYAELFPPMDSFGQATLSFMLVFSLNNLIILFFIYYCCCYLLFPLCFTRSSSHFFAIFSVVGFPLITLSIYSSFSNQQNQNKQTNSLTLISLISSWMLAISILLALLAYNIIFKLQSYTNCNLVLGGAFLSLINVCFPYLSVELLLRFIYTNSLISSNSDYDTLFQLNKPYASMVLAEVYYVFFCGIAFVLNANVIIQYRLEYLGSYSAKQQLLFQSLSIFLEQTLILMILNVRLWYSRPTGGSSIQNSAIILGIIIFGSALIVFHLLTQFLMFRFSSPDDNLVKIMSVSLILEYLLLILLLVVMILMGVFSNQKIPDKLFQEQQIVFLVVISLIILFTYPRILYTNLVIFPKSLLVQIIELERDESEMIELIKIDFETVLDRLSPVEIKELEDYECAICLSPFQTSEENAEAAPIAKLRSCGHAFHQLCIKGWLQFRGICPLDRKKVE